MEWGNPPSSNCSPEAASPEGVDCRRIRRPTKTLFDDDATLRNPEEWLLVNELATTAPAVAAGPAQPSLEQRILEELEAAAAPLTATALRKLCQVKNATLQAAITALVANGRLRKDRAGYALAR
jgi:hypothetical protein